jgi:hypothetical protein
MMKMNDDCKHEHTLSHVVDFAEEVEEKCVVCGTVIQKGTVQWETMTPGPQKETCDNCGVKLPCDAGFKVEATCIENDDPDDTFEAHLCHECFSRIEGDVFKK